jgi:hypothetical protein
VPIVIVIRMPHHIGPRLFGRYDGACYAPSSQFASRLSDDLPSSPQAKPAHNDSYDYVRPARVDVFRFGSPSQTRSALRIE